MRRRLPNARSSMSKFTHPNRRQFIWSAGAGLALPLTTSRVLGAGRPFRGANEQIGLGIIGMGIRGRNLLNRWFLKNDGFRVLAVCDVDRTRREDAKQRVDRHYKNRDCRAENDYRALLQRNDIDAVVIATPDHWHANQILDACVAGKDIYCEKPLTLTLHEARVVIDAVRKTGRIFQTGSQQRTEFGHRFVRASELIRNGRIGKVHNVNVGVGNAPVPCDLGKEAPPEGLDWDRWLGPAPARPYHPVLSPRGVHSHYPKWRSYREYAGGGLADMGAHHFDIVQWALDADRSGPVRVVPASKTGDVTGAWVEYASGTKVFHGGPSGCTFVGKSGVIHVDRGRLEGMPRRLLEKKLDEKAERLPRRKNHVEDWLQGLRNRTQPICDVEVGARSVAICHLLNIAYWHRRELTWNPATWRFAEEDANAWLDCARRPGYELPTV